MGIFLPNVSSHFSDIRDGTSNTIMTGELQRLTPQRNVTMKNAYEATSYDGWALGGRSDLRAGEEALRRWLAAAALVRPAPQGGRVAFIGIRASLGGRFTGVRRALWGYEAPCNDPCPDCAPC